MGHRDRPVYFAIHSAMWRFAAEEFADLSARIFEAERSFFSDFDQPYYLVTLIPIDVARTNGSSMGGTGLQNTFALFMTPTVELTGDLGRRTKHLLAHELFHHWNGRVIEREDPEELVYWFSEGFTDYYAGRLLWRAGLWSLEDFLQAANSWLGCWITRSVE